MPRRKVSFSNGEGGGGGREVLEACETKDLARFPRRATEREITTTLLSPPPLRAPRAFLAPAHPFFRAATRVFLFSKKKKSAVGVPIFASCAPLPLLPILRLRNDGWTYLWCHPGEEGGREIFFFRDSIDRLNLKNNLLYKRGSMKINNPLNKFL